MDTLWWQWLGADRWGDGPWNEEPEKVQWPDPGTGLPCLAVRGPMGAWCGYVGLEPGHPFYGLDYCRGCALRPEPCGKAWCDHAPASLLSVHGGLTYSGACQEDEHGICHVLGPGEEPHLWWLGFDASHAGDLVPSLLTLFSIPADMRGTYRTLAYMQAECAHLAQQLDARDWAARLEAMRVARRAEEER